MNRPDPSKVYLATVAFVTEIDGRQVTISKGSLRMGDEPVVIHTFSPNLWIEEDLDPETKAKRHLAQASEKSARGYTLKEIQDRYRELRSKLGHGPTQDQMATALHISVATLKRTLRDLGKAAWPPF